MFNLVIAVSFMTKLSLYNIYMTIGIYNIVHKDNPNKCYIGSSKTCERRFTKHKYNIKNNIKNFKVYQEIRADGIENYIFEIIEKIEDDDEMLLKEKEQHYITTLNPCLNTRNAYLTEDERYEASRILWTNRNKVSMDCECGRNVLKTHIARHKKTKRHKTIMINKKIKELKDLVGDDLKLILGI